MSIFVKNCNRMTGKEDWSVQTDNFDQHQEIARSAFADMLHDSERNQLYEKALAKAIKSMHLAGRKANVLDIGTGSGLLSMMAVRHGADSVTACEAFEPMSVCARKILRENNMEHLVKIIPKRSTDISKEDMAERCNILVTEVFDTELIGEGALSTFSHAVKNLLEEDCIIVPEAGTIYAQVIESQDIFNWHKLNKIGRIEIPEAIRNCAGSAAVHDVQLDEIPLDGVKFLTEPSAVLRFNWSGPLVFNRSTVSSLKVLANGKAQAVFMWWELDMAPNIILSCAPKWVKKQPIAWRDHWMQAIYYFPQELQVSQNEELHLISCHDEFSLWFNASKTLAIKPQMYERSFCTCGLHNICPRARLGQLNDSSRNQKMLEVFSKKIDEHSEIVVLGETFFLALNLKAKKMFFVEPNVLSRGILLELLRKNNLENRVVVLENFEDLKKCDLSRVRFVLGEPFFHSTILPWDNVLFGCYLEELQNFLGDNVEILPGKAVIKGVAVRFENLHKIRLPLGQCEGFKMDIFDQLIENSSNLSDDKVEAQPLWEYPGQALSKIETLATIDFTTKFSSKLLIEKKDYFENEFKGNCNGIAFWLEWHFDGLTLSGGPQVPPKLGERISWDMHTRQGVILFPETASRKLSYRLSLDISQGNFTFLCPHNQ